MLCQIESKKYNANYNKNVPKWVYKTPTSPNKLYAVGMVGPTYFKEDAREYAADDARNELAKSISSKVESIILLIEKESNVYVDEAYRVNATSWSTDIVLTGSTILSYWYDVQGIGPNRVKNSTYALAVIPKEDLIGELNSFLQKNINKELVDIAKKKIKEVIK